MLNCNWWKLGERKFKVVVYTISIGKHNKMNCLKYWEQKKCRLRLDMVIYLKGLHLLIAKYFRILNRWWIIMSVSKKRTIWLVKLRFNNWSFCTCHHIFICNWTYLILLAITVLQRKHLLKQNNSLLHAQLYVLK